MKTKHIIAAGTAAALILSAGTAFADSDVGHGDDHHGLRVGAFIGLGNNAELKANWKGDKDAAREHRTEIKESIMARLGDMRHHEDGDRDDESHDADDHSAKTALRGEVTAIGGTTLTLAGSDGTTYTVVAADADVKGGTVADIDVGDHVIVRGTLSDATLTAITIVDTDLLRELFAEKMSHFSVGTVTAITGAVFTIDPKGDKDVTTVTTDTNTVFKVSGEATTSSALSVGDKVFLVGTTTASSTDADAFSASIVEIITDGFKKLKHWFFSR